jgi:hypothetical protein
MLISSPRANMSRPLLRLGQALAMALSLSCGRDEPVPANANKTIKVPPRDTAAIRAHRNDSAFVVLHAAAALDKIQGRHVLRLKSYQRTDSGTVMSFVAMCGRDYKSPCLGGGGRVFVDSLGKAKVIELYQ